MDKNLRHIFATVKRVNKANGLVEAMASVNVVDRSGDLILPSAFVNRLSAFRKNPVMLFAHDYGAWPIGKINEISIVTNGLQFVGEFSPTEEGQKAKANFEFGSLNAFSVGFLPHEWRSPNEDEMKTFGSTLSRVMTDVELLEISAVPVPANPEALAIAAGWGIKMQDMEDVKQFVERVRAQTKSQELTEFEEREALKAAEDLMEKLELDLFERKLTSLVG